MAIGESVSLSTSTAEYVNICTLLFVIEAIGDDAGNVYGVGIKVLLYAYKYEVLKLAVLNTMFGSSLVTVIYGVDAVDVKSEERRWCALEKRVHVWCGSTCDEGSV